MLGVHSTHLELQLVLVAHIIKKLHL